MPGFSHYGAPPVLHGPPAGVYIDESKLPNTQKSRRCYMVAMHEHAEVPEGRFAAAGRAKYADYPVTLYAGACGGVRG